MNEQTKSIFVRVTLQEKIRIDRSAKSCGLSLSEYLRKRALGYEPKPIPPDSFLLFNSSWTIFMSSVRTGSAAK